MAIQLRQRNVTEHELLLEAEQRASALGVLDTAEYKMVVEITKLVFQGSIITLRDAGDKLQQINDMCVKELEKQQDAPPEHNKDEISV